MSYTQSPTTCISKSLLRAQFYAHRAYFDAPNTCIQLGVHIQALLFCSFGVPSMCMYPMMVVSCVLQCTEHDYRMARVWLRRANVHAHSSRYTYSSVVEHVHQIMVATRVLPNASSMDALKGLLRAYFDTTSMCISCSASSMLCPIMFAPCVLRCAEHFCIPLLLLRAELPSMLYNGCSMRTSMNLNTRSSVKYMAQPSNSQFIQLCSIRRFLIPTIKLPNLSVRST